MKIRKEVNYSLKFTVADASRIFKTDKKTIKDWAYFFSEYMNKGANPQKGNTRVFLIDDMRVMAFVLPLWDDELDMENIKYGLNTNSHYESESIDNLITELTPIFIDPPENLDEAWKHGALFSGLAGYGDTFYLANSYKRAGDRLVDAALDDEQPWALVCPAIYNYRHATELYLKAITGYYDARHNLQKLYSRLAKLVKTEFNEPIPDWFKNVFDVFHEFDPGGTSFRYGGDISGGEVFVDFRQLKTLMDKTARIFQKIRTHQGLPDAIL
jgi:hypothetical protein